MKSRRSASAWLTAGLSVFLIFPIAMATNAARKAFPASLPTFHSEVAGQHVVLSPLSAQKATAVQEFKLAQN